MCCQKAENRTVLCPYVSFSCGTSFDRLDCFPELMNLLGDTRSSGLYTVGAALLLLW